MESKVSGPYFARHRRQNDAEIFLLCVPSHPSSLPALPLSTDRRALFPLARFPGFIFSLSFGRLHTLMFIRTPVGGDTIGAELDFQFAFESFERFSARIKLSVKLRYNSEKSGTHSGYSLGWNDNDDYDYDVKSVLITVFVFLGHRKSLTNSLQSLFK